MSRQFALRGIFFVVGAFILSTGFSPAAFAACANPTRDAGAIIYNSDFKTMQFCDGADWWNMKSAGGAETDPQVNTLANGKWCTTDGTVIDCVTDPPLTSESDPQVGTLTNTKWCTTDGSVIDCTADAPADLSATNELQTLSQVLTQGNDAGGQSASNFSTVALTSQIKLGDSASACNAGNAGAIRYNTTTKIFEGCNGTAWADVGGCSALKLDDLADAQISVTPTDGDVIVFENASGLWKDNPCDSTPTPFDFPDLVDQNLSTLVTSQIMQVTGLSCTAGLAISGDGAPQYRVCSTSNCSSEITTWTNAPGSINDGNYIQLRLTTAATTNITQTADLTIGPGSVNWAATTIKPKIVFVASAVASGNMGGVTGADGICQTLASNAGLTGTFLAWAASSAANDPESRFTRPPATQNYELVNGTVIANGWADLVDGSIDNFIDRKENGTSAGSLNVRTGVNSDGTWAGTSNDDCIGWSAAGANSSQYGITNITDGRWTNQGNNNNCGNSSYLLYCFEQ